MTVGAARGRACAASPKPDSDRAINHFLERDAKLPDALFEKTRQVIVECESDPHDGHQVHTVR